MKSPIFAPARLTSTRMFTLQGHTARYLTWSAKWINVTFCRILMSTWPGFHTGCLAFYNGKVIAHVARNLLKMATTWKGLFQRLLTRAAFLETSLGAIVIQRARPPSAGLLALVSQVLWVHWMTHHVTHVTTLKSFGTWYGATPIGCLFKVVST